MILHYISYDRSSLEYQTHSTTVPASEVESQRKYIQNQKSSTCSPSNDSQGVCNVPGNVDASINLKIVEKEEDCLHSVHSSEDFNRKVCNEDESVFISSRNRADMTGTVFNEEEIVRSFTAVLLLSSI